MTALYPRLNDDQLEVLKRTLDWELEWGRLRHNIDKGLYAEMERIGLIREDVDREGVYWLTEKGYEHIAVLMLRRMWK